MAVRSVANNAPIRPVVKRVFTLDMLRSLVRYWPMYTALLLLGFFGFYRLSTLVPPNGRSFDRSRYLTHGDIVWGNPGAHIITTCSKAMQKSGQMQVVQVPKLQDRLICPVRALRAIVSKHKNQEDKPLFTNSLGQVIPAYRMRLELKGAIRVMGWATEGLGYHTLRRSGASWAFDHGINLDHLKAHGGWRSDAVWKYLIKTPSAAAKVAHTFKAHIKYP